MLLVAYKEHCRQAAIARIIPLTLLRFSTLFLQRIQAK